MGGSPGLLVMGGDSYPEGRGFESQHCILLGHKNYFIFCLLINTYRFVFIVERGPSLWNFLPSQWWHHKKVHWELSQIIPFVLMHHFSLVSKKKINFLFALVLENLKTFFFNDLTLTDLKGDARATSMKKKKNIFQKNLRRWIVRSPNSWKNFHFYLKIVLLPLRTQKFQFHENSAKTRFANG